ncbi:AroM family protein [Xylophilus rhododendri]|uniref:AroM family protein n=1 Tax=Xylophilus rhododendri TaxID=2697032 RepID=A0A857J248_9BURK|nr:AroM family protein [Xylophilus rhododendri]QHI97697.1 AroM family protein [Xylophilus rhododendri]
MSTPRPTRIGFATIGQSPRDDAVPAIVAALGRPVEVVEAGGLDGLDAAAIAAMAPQAGEYSFATRMADGSQVVLGKPAAEVRLAKVMEHLDGQQLDIVVALCAGTQIPPLKNALLIEPQRIVDGLTEAIAANARRIGIVLPLERQLASFHLEAEVAAEVQLAHASPYEGDRFAEAGRELAGCDVIVMHCMGYTEAMRAKVATASGRPTLAAPALVAGVLRQLIDMPATA